MRIFEITDKNIVWNSIHQIDVGFKSEYEFIVKLLTILIPLNSIHRNQKAMLNVQEFKNRATTFLSIKYPDSADNDLIRIRTEVENMIRNIDRLLTQLIIK